MGVLAVGTDFSTRSDRALRRATLLARQGGYELLIVHVAEGDQPQRLVESHQGVALELLREMEHTTAEGDGVRCRSEIRLGRVSEQVIAAAQEAGAELIVLGPHRRTAFRDSFGGITAERIIRDTPIPIIAANAVPAGPYRRLLLSTDLQAQSQRAAEALPKLGFTDDLEAVFLHVYDAEARQMLGRAMAPAAERSAYLEDRAMRARDELAEFVKSTPWKGARQIVRESEGSFVDGILAAAADEGTDLIVVARSNKGFIEEAFVGSVTSGMLREGEHDVLIYPAK